MFVCLFVVLCLLFVSIGGGAFHSLQAQTLSWQLKQVIFDNCLFLNNHATRTGGGTAVTNKYTNNIQM
jgi:hypothetical protein